jgi:hypothetical protein
MASILLLCGLRGLRVAASCRTRSALSLLQALAVGATYEVARATALVSRSGHHRERSMPQQSAGAPTR